MAKSKKEIQQFWAERGVAIPMDHVFTVKENEQRIPQIEAQQTAEYIAAARNQQNALIRQMQQQQLALLRAANKPAPKASQSLKSRNYQPKFKTRGSKLESNRAVSRGTQQFANPLSMGGGFGSSGSPNLG